MEAEKPIAVYRTSRKKIVLESIVFFCVITLQALGQSFAIINLGGGTILFGMIAALVLIVLISDLYKFTIVEIYPDHVSVKKPVFKKRQTVRFEDFQKMYFGTGESTKVSGIKTRALRLLNGHYKDVKRKMLMAEFQVDYLLFKNYEQLVLDIWTRTSCKKIIDLHPAETADIYKALKMKASEAELHQNQGL